MQDAVRVLMKRWERVRDANQSMLLATMAFGGFPKLGVPFLGVPKGRTIVFGGLYWGPPILGNYLLGFRVQV